MHQPAPPRTPGNRGGARLPYESGFFEINQLNHRSSDENLPIREPLGKADFLNTIYFILQSSLTEEPATL
jgi:hypothetical protein